jgi:hypothetical protein
MLTKPYTVRFEVSAVVTVKNVVFWDVSVQILYEPTTCSRWFSLADFSALKMETTRSSETLVHTRSTRRHIPEYGIPQPLCYLIRSHWFYQFSNLRC